jgi:hypothetical protein
MRIHEAGSLAVQGIDAFWQSKGQEFDPPSLHHINVEIPKVTASWDFFFFVVFGVAFTNVHKRSQIMNGVGQVQGIRGN